MRQHHAWADTLITRAAPPGVAQAWGANDAGQLGNPNLTGLCGQLPCRPTPVPVGDLGKVIAVAAGGQHSLALQDDGTVRAWGANQYGQLGTTPSLGSVAPLPINGPRRVIAIAGSPLHSLALQDDGTVWAWGENRYGQLGGPTTDTCGRLPCRSTPAPISSVREVTAIAAGWQHSLAIVGTAGTGDMTATAPSKPPATGGGGAQNQGNRSRGFALGLLALLLASGAAGRHRIDLRR